ncbi:hypothetical protein V2A60_009085 [Cordyceps javanica]|uniref:Regulator of chromosome condensation (RCC1)-like protein n=1 Tax=Cordyceps javanica TaxID=43265 RepID=A0A545VNW4_9HYPO|nr:regulator of chromosome condensation (RCC1)-like protein [Cordyceps javanica]TQW03420.1 regulator of chromosome condensation (RCC1)-like protein [Cordyceps javanica]
MSWHNSNNPSRRPPGPRHTSPRPNDDSEYPPLGLGSAQSLSNTTSNAAPMPRMIAAARERLANSSRERINSILGDSPYTTRRWTPAPGEDAHHTRQSRPNLPPSRLDVAPQLSTSPLSVPPLSGDFASQSPYPNNRMSSLEQLDRTLDEANAHLRALLDMSAANRVSHHHLPPNHPPAYTPSTRTHDFTYDNQRNKRRKVDEERYTHGVPNFRYGHYGQVESGDLHMEMVSCDGGMFSNESSYAAENILRNDNTVYCTKGNRCNIVLRHRGSTPFTLSELVIKAPGSMNYSHPVREGMVFITMDDDDVLHRTTQYQIQYAPTATGAAAAARDRVTFTNTDPRTRFNRESQQTISISHNRDGTMTSRPGRSFIYSHEQDVRMPQMPREFNASQPDFRISTEFSDEDDDAAGAGNFGAPVSILRRRTPNRIGPLPFENDADSDSPELRNDRMNTTFLREISNRFPSRGNSPGGDRHLAAASTDDLLNTNFEHWSTLVEVSADPSAASTAAASHGGGQHGGSTALAEAWDAHANATQEAIRAVGGAALLAPHARFHIEKKKSKCTIRFDPPVSGRFILLKMWSSHHDQGSNIDIQSVLVRGFAGPRYFPSLEMR